MVRTWWMAALLAVGATGGCSVDCDEMIPDDVSMKKTSPGTCGVVVLGDVGGISAADFQRVLMRSLQEHPVFASVNDSSSAEYVLTVSLRDYAMVGRADRLTTRCILVRTVDGKTIWDDTLNI